jgi:uncharacterized membrane protein
VVVGLELFQRFGISAGLRWLHVLFGIAWIGLLYYFNFVQVPSFAEMSAAARNEALTKLASRALWWFRWAALGTAIFGILITGATKDYYKNFFSRANGASIFLGIVIAMTMLYNVWMVIWPNQRIVIANAANVLAGEQPDPAAAAAGRRSFLASRQNVMFSIPMLWFMVATAHFYNGGAFVSSGDPGGGKVWGFLVIALVIWGVLEANALGFIGGTSAGPTKQLYERVPSVIISGFVLWLILWILSEIFLKG